MASLPQTQEPGQARGRRVRRASGDERESAILETAEALLESQPFHEISIDDLARGAGISRSTFYFYFPSKEAVLLTLLDGVIAHADAGHDRAKAMLENNPAAFLRDSINAYVTSFGSHRAVTLAGAEAHATNPEVRKLWNQVREGWVQEAASAIAAERDRGAAPPGPPARDLAIALIQMNEGVLRATFAGDEPAVDEDDLIDVLHSIWLNAVYGHVPPAPLAETAPALRPELIER
ncbi:MAG: TetR/AcrR family transcriptional regulator [Solirubrobacterales bacterium]